MEFADAAKLREYMEKVSAQLGWVSPMAMPVVVVDALLSDFPIIAVSDQFMGQTKYRREDVLFTNCRFLLENVSGPDVFRISRSSRAAIRAFCQLSRFPRAISGGADQNCQQPNCMADSKILMNRFVMRRTYVCGHPMIIGVQHFTQVADTVDGENDPKASAVEDERLSRENDSLLDDIVARMKKDLALAELLAHGREAMHEQTPSTDVCHRADGRSGPKNVLFYNGSGVLRQEPDTLPNTGIICTAVAIEPDAAGDIRFSLRVEELARWQDYPPMGFTQIEPWQREMLPEFLQFAPRTCCFCSMGAMCNESDQPLSPFSRPSPLESNPTSLPKLSVGDVLTVELTQDMRLRRSVNGKYVQEVQMPRKVLDKPWYGCFQLSFSVSRAIVTHDSYREQKEALPEEEVPKTTLASVMALLVKDFVDVSVTMAMSSAELDYPLIAVSPGFEQLTGYSMGDIIGRNCRFLNTGSDMSVTDRMGIRAALAKEKRFTTVLPNLRRDSSLFLNLLDLRTLEVGKECKSEAPVRIVVGIQGEVDSGRSDAQWREELPALTAQIREDIRTRLARCSRVLTTEDGEFIEPHKQPFWLDEPVTQQMVSASSSNASPFVKPTSNPLAGMAAAPAPSAPSPCVAPSGDTKPTKWTPAMVGQFLQSIDMPMYVDAFMTERVDGEVLLDLDEESMGDLQVKKIHRKKLLRAIEVLRK